MIQIYDTLQGAVVPFEPALPGRVGIYVCGVTPYADPHVGHARPAVIWDVIRRHLERRGYVVTLVQNYTDVDDRIITRARQEGISAAALASRHGAQYWALIAGLGVRHPDYMPRATGNMGAIVTVIERLLGEGAAYEAAGDVYFRVRRFPRYGALSHRRVDELRTAVRIDVNPLKEDPLDFALWKRALPEEPSWSSPWGAGRPGWHVECTAMAWRYLGPVVDLHGGATDLIFPHHENERAQSETALGVHPHVRYWVHNGLITTNGVKMSKSLDNGMSLAVLMDRFPPAVVRGYLLSVHYRTPLEYTVEALEDFGRGYQRVLRLWDTVRDAPPAQDPLPDQEAPALRDFPNQLLSLLDQDFNTAEAWALVFDMIRAANRLMGDRATAGTALALARRNLLMADEALGLLLPRPRAVERRGVPDRVEALVSQRETLRLAKDYPAADRLRQEIRTLGYSVEDTADGPVVRLLDDPGVLHRGGDTV